MKITLILLVLFCGCLSVIAQETEVKLNPAKDDAAAKIETVKEQPATAAAAAAPAKDETATPALVPPAVATTGSDAPVKASLKETLEKEINNNALAQIGDEKNQSEKIGG